MAAAGIRRGSRCADSLDLFEPHAARGRTACSSVGSRCLSSSRVPASGICSLRSSPTFVIFNSTESIYVEQSRQVSKLASNFN